MSHTIAPIASHVATQRDALCAQAARVLTITAKQWGMCPPNGVESPKAAALLPRKTAVALPCLALRAWALNTWTQPA